MKLTGKTREEFYNWYEENINVSIFNKTRNLVILNFVTQSETCQNALIIEFFDSVGYQIGIEPIQGGDFRCYVWVNKFEHIWIDKRFESRTEATNDSILKANELFNQNK